MPRFRKKPVEIEAVQIKVIKLDEEVLQELRDTWPFEGYPEWLTDAISEARIIPYHLEDSEYFRFSIETDEGVMVGGPGDWIIRDAEGEIYPCKASVFEATYEPIP